MRVKIYTDDIIIMINDEYFKVSRYTKRKKLIENHAYIIGGSDIVYVYRGKYKNKYKDIPGMYITESGIKFVDPSPDERYKYSTENIIQLDIESIFTKVKENKDNFKDMNDIELINNNSELYIPTIRDDDDFLKYLIKRAIIDKKINLKSYKDKFKDQTSLSNMKSSLNGSTKMTTLYWKQWCEVLGIRWDITIEDSGEDNISPLPNSITIHSEDF